jgi:hypothetical protein
MQDGKSSHGLQSFSSINSVPTHLNFMQWIKKQFVPNPSNTITFTVFEPLFLPSPFPGDEELFPCGWKVAGMSQWTNR